MTEQNPDRDADTAPLQATPNDVVETGGLADRPVRRWPWALGGGLAGAVLAASVAVPVAVYADREADTTDAPGSSAGGSADPDRFADRVPEGLPDELPDGRLPGVPFGRFGDGASGGAAATDAQSRGVVLIETAVGEEGRTGVGAGTGMVLSSNGLVLTNYHVVEDSSAVTVTVATSGVEYAGEVVGYDQTADVALIQLDAPDADLETVDLDDDGTEIDEAVTAVGNAWGQGSLSVVTGSILAEDQSITAGDRFRADGEPLSGLIETDAGVVSGYSGGPLLDADGEVVGINTAASFSRSLASAGAGNQSYAVPIDDALAVVELIEAGDESGSVTIGPAAYLGVSISARGAGARVVAVEAAGPAADAGLAAGDTVTGLDGAEVTSYETLVDALAQYEPGEEVELTWTGPGGAQGSGTVTLGESPVN